ncbi:hypothetical protein K8T06_04425 [bacterium]|nr:hypothetical protein [bacterium]
MSKNAKIMVICISILFSGCVSTPEASTDLLKLTSNQAGTSSYADFKELQYTVNHRLIIEAYKKVGKKDPVWDDAVLDFLDNVTLKLSGKGGGSYRKLSEMGDRLIQMGCNDPMVLNYYGLALNKTNQVKKAKVIIRQSIEGLKESNYPPNQMMFASLRMIILLMELKEKSEMDQYWDMNLQATLDVMSSDIYRDGEQRIMFSHIVHCLNAMDTRYMEPMIKLIEKVENLEGVDPWVKLMVQGTFHIDRAWNLRSNKKAHDVSESGWKGFKSHLELAYSCLKQAWELHPEYPESAVKLIVVAMGGGTPREEDERFWFDRAQKAQFDHKKAYSNYIYASLPKWGGSYEQILSFGQECLNTNRFDTIVPHQYIEAISQICRGRGDYRLTRRAGVYENIEIMCQGYIAETSRSSRKNYYRSILAAAAWRADKEEESRKILVELGKDVSRKGLKVLKVSPRDILGGM